MVKENRKSWMKKEKFSLHALPISGCSSRRDLGCLLSLAGRFKPPTRLFFWGLPSVIMRHCKTAEQGSMLISYSFWCVSFILHPHRQAHHIVSKTENVYTEKADRLELWVFLPCSEHPGEAPKMIAYDKRSQVCDLQRRFSLRTRDQVWPLRAIVWQKFY